MDGQSLIAEILRRDAKVSAGTALSDIDGWDSLKGVKLILRLEEVTGAELSEASIESLQTVGDIDRLLGAGS